jgi:hypothetical protein
MEQDEPHMFLTFVERVDKVVGVMVDFFPGNSTHVPDFCLTPVLCIHSQIMTHFETCGQYLL